MRTIQELCDYSVLKIVEQGKQCLGADNVCSYSDGQGNHCAVGWLAPKDHPDYASIMGYKGDVRDLIHNYELPELEKHCQTLDTLQIFHDVKPATLRMRYLSNLKSAGINTDKPQYQQWVELGE